MTTRRRPEDTGGRRCSCCGKVLFPSTKQARHASRRYGDRVRTYPCPEGGGWHVTTQAVHNRTRARNRRRR